MDDDLQAMVDDLKQRLMIIFQKWKALHGQEPEPEGSLLTGHKKVPFNDAPPYKCAGGGVHGYTELLWYIYGEELSLDMLTAGYAAFTLDKDCMSYSHPAQRAYSQRIELKLAHQKSALDKPDAILGRHRRSDLKAWHEKVHGTKLEKDLRWGRYQLLVNKCHKDKPSWGITSIREYVAEQESVSAKTIARYTYNPMKKV